MTATVAVSLTDTAIKRYAADPGVRQLKDPRHPLRLRYLTDRARAAWYLVQYRAGKTLWRKLGTWPHLTAKALLARLPDLLAESSVNPDTTPAVSGWETVGDLLAWYGARAEQDTSLSPDRKADIASALRCHLVPRLGKVRLEQLDKACLDERLIWPLQQRYQVSSVKAWFAILKSATARAAKLRRLPADPLAAVNFSDFTAAPLPVKAGKLRPAAVPALLSTLACTRPMAQALVVMMLAHGSRIGETRKARWEHIEGDAWFIPAENTKTREAHLLPLTPPLRGYLDAYRQQCKSSAWLFPAATRGCISAAEASALVRVVSERHWTAHDLRKLARTRWTDQGTDYLVGELLLNHALTNLDKAYIHTHAEQQKRIALEQYHHWLMGQGLDVVLAAIGAETAARQSETVKTAQSSAVSGVAAVSEGIQ